LFLKILPVIFYSEKKSQSIINMKTIEYKETTIKEIHAAILRKETSCVALIEFYLGEIDKFDKKGPCINSIIYINPRAMEEAKRLDTEFLKTGKLAGPLHGIPVLLKDNCNTFDMPTTAGSLLFKDFIPGEDAYIVTKLKMAGAIILAKTNLHELATWGETVSSLLGQTLNPYDLTRTPGGSSGGTGAGIAANFGVIGIGTDTINSIRSPASACSLAGIRPTMGLVSRSGLLPFAESQDIAGPICRSVEDAARTLEVIAGRDSADSSTALAEGKISANYTVYLKADGLKGKRIGVLESFFGKEEVHREVNRVVRGAIKVFSKNGAETISLNEPLDSSFITGSVSVHLDEFRENLNGYLASLGQWAPVHSLKEIYESGKYHPSLKANIEKALASSTDSEEYKNKRKRIDEITTRVLQIMDENKLDAIIYPHQQRLVCKIGGPQLERNGVLTSVMGFPSIALPAGFSESGPDAPLGVPVGMEIIGRPWSEGVLLEIAYAFEQATMFRKAPLLNYRASQPPSTANV